MGACDICGGSGVDYWGRPCRLCRPAADDRLRWQAAVRALRYQWAAKLHALAVDAGYDCCG